MIWCISAASLQLLCILIPELLRLSLLPPVSCWWTAWPSTETGVPSASRWRRSWSNSPETSTVLFRWEKDFLEVGSTLSHCQHLQRTQLPAPVKCERLKSSVEEGKHILISKSPPHLEQAFCSFLTCSVCKSMLTVQRLIAHSFLPANSHKSSWNRGRDVK